MKNLIVTKNNKLHSSKSPPSASVQCGHGNCRGSIAIPVLINAHLHTHLLLVLRRARERLLSRQWLMAFPRAITFVSMSGAHFQSSLYPYPYTSAFNFHACSQPSISQKFPNTAYYMGAEMIKGVKWKI